MEPVVDTATEPELPPSLFGATVEIVTPRPLAAVIEGLAQVTTRTQFGYPTIWSDGGGRAVVAYDHVGYFEIFEGTLVSFHRDPNCAPGLPAAALFNGVPSILLAQQGRFALHASTVDVGGSRVAIAGDSGSGKSTTSLALVARGAAPVVDDVTVLDLIDGRMVTRSFGRPAYVFPHVLEELGIDAGLARPLGHPSAKVAVTWPDADPVAVDVIAVLRPAEIDHLAVHELEGSVAVRALQRMTHMATAVQERHRAALFDWHVAVATRTRVAVIVRPASGWPLAEVCAAVERLAGATAPCQREP